MDIVVCPVKRPFNVCSDYIIGSSGVPRPESFNVGSIELDGGPFAFDGHGFTLALCEYEIHLMTPFVSPVKHLPGLDLRVHLVQHIVFPQSAIVVPAKLMPSPVMTYKAGIKGINLWRGDDFGWKMCAERPYHMGDIGHFENGEVIGDRSAADLAGMGKACCLEYPSALDHEQFGKFQE